MSWIKEIPFEKAKGKLKQLYLKVCGPENNVDNIMSVHSLRPHTMEGHMRLYKNVLHHSGNTLPKSFLETVGVYVSFLNHCSYCVDHHYAGLVRLINDPVRSEQIMDALESNELDRAFNLKERSGLDYARKLTLEPITVVEEDLEYLRRSDYDDGEILELNQVISYFNYVNRTVLGLGVTTKGDILGLSPGDSNDADNWNHN